MFQNLFHWLLGAGKEMAVVIIAALPVVELRGAVPLGIAAGIPWFETLCLSIIGNLLPIPLVLFGTEKLLSFLEKRPPFVRIAKAYRKKLESKQEKVLKYATIGLMLFIAIPLPGTGAWSGAAIASLLKMPIGKALLSITGGVCIAGLIMTILMQGTVWFSNMLW